MADIGIKELLEAGVHFGHQTRRWNPKMGRFIFGERDGIYIIDLLQTDALLHNAREFAAGVSRRGGTVLFVGTKKQARDAIKETADAAEMPYVNHRWLGGLLTNFQTISLRIKRLHDLERYESEGQLQLLPTRERMAAQADLEKLRANLGGVKNMQRVPDAVFVIDLKTEAIAVREAQRLRIPIIGLVDTNCDPDGIDFVIPGNDDAITSCEAVTRAIGDVVTQGHSAFRAEEEHARLQRERQQAEERARREAEEQARREAEEKARAKEEARREAEEQRAREAEPAAAAAAEAEEGGGTQAVTLPHESQERDLASDATADPDPFGFRVAVFDKEWDMLVNRATPRLKAQLEAERDGWRDRANQIGYFGGGGNGSSDSGARSETVSFDLELATSRASLGAERLQYLELLLDASDATWRDTLAGTRRQLAAESPGPNFFREAGWLLYGGIGTGRESGTPSAWRDTPILLPELPKAEERDQEATALREQMLTRLGEWFDDAIAAHLDDKSTLVGKRPVDTTSDGSG